MPSLVDILLEHLAACNTSEEDRLQAIGQLRAETWIAALSVIVDIEGQVQAEQSLEALTQADSFLVLLALGWAPNRTSSQAIVTPTRAAKALHRQLGHALERWLESEPHDPGSVVRAIEAAYRQTLTRILRGASPRVRSGIIATHYAFRRTIVSSALELIASSHTKRHQGLMDVSPLLGSETSHKSAQSVLEASPPSAPDADRSLD